MKNFYDATVIRPNLTMDLEIWLKPVDLVYCEVLVNQESMFHGKMIDPTVIKKTLPIDSEVMISIQIINQRVHPQALEIENINIDNYNILPLYQHLCDPGTNYIDFNMPWYLKIPNFYPWYHEISGQGFIA